MSKTPSTENHGQLGWGEVGASSYMFVRDEVNPEEFSGERFSVLLESF